MDVKDYKTLAEYFNRASFQNKVLYLFTENIFLILCIQIDHYICISKWHVWKFSFLINPKRIVLYVSEKQRGKQWILCLYIYLSFYS